MVSAAFPADLEVQAALPPERMRRMHLALLSEAADTDLPPGPEGRLRVREFVAAVAVSGSMLETADERRGAQGILDYWVACLNMSPDAAALKAPVSARLTPFDEAALKPLLAKLDGLTADEKTLAVLLLAALVRPDERDDMQPVARTRDDWTGQLGPQTAPERVEAAADALVDAGVVVESTDAEAGGPIFELASSALARRWQPLQDAVSARAQLRERARLWAKTGKTDAIFSRNVMPGANQLPGRLDPIEQKYREFRSRVGLRRQGLLLGVGIILLFGLAATGLVYSWYRQARFVEAAAVEHAAKLQADADKFKAEAAALAANVQLQAEQALKEPIRQAIETRDAPALITALRNSDIQVPDDALMFTPTEAPPPEAPARVDQVALASLANSDDVCSGFIAVGSDPRYFLRDPPPLTSSAWKDHSFVTLTSLRLRRGASGQDQSQSVGLIRAGTTFEAQASPVPDPNAKPPGYVLPIVTPGPNCTIVYVQYAGQDQTDLAKSLISSLSAYGYDMRGPERITSASGLAEIRYYFADDAARARALAARVGEALGKLGLPGREIKVNNLTNYPQKKPPPGTVELWVDLAKG